MHESSSAPLAGFFTWTVYGTFLPGDRRGWRHREQGHSHPRPLLEQWHRDRLKHDVILLTDAMRECVGEAIQEICSHRRWKLWSVNVRTNHVHAVISMHTYAPATVLEQLKSKATRELRQRFELWMDRPVWSANGDIEFLDTEADIEQCVMYTNDAQSRKGVE